MLVLAVRVVVVVLVLAALVLAALTLTALALAVLALAVLALAVPVVSILVVMPPTTVPLHTQPCAKVARLVIGGAAQCVLVVYAGLLGAGPEGRNCALTRTGMTAPVLRLNA